MHRAQLSNDATRHLTVKRVAHAPTSTSGPHDSVVELDVIRATAALAVMSSHARMLFFVPWPEVVHPSLAAKIAYALTGMGHQSVMVFFVLSGYLVGGSAVRTIRAGRWSWSAYLARRLARLYVVLVPAIVLGSLWDWAGMRLFWATGVYRGLSEDRWILPFSIAANSAWSTRLGNLVFLQTIRTPTLGSNGALWSLSNEWWYYVVFPLIALPLLASHSARARAVLWALAAGALWFTGESIAIYFSVWLLGGLVALLRRVRVRRAALWRISLLGASCALLGALMLSRTAGIRESVGDLAVSLAFAALLYTVVRKPSHMPSARMAGVWQTLAGCSFTLYVVHMPVLVFAHAGLHRSGGSHWQPSVAGATITGALSAAIVVYAWVLARVTELRTDEFRARVIEPCIAAVQRAASALDPRIAARRA